MIDRIMEQIECVVDIPMGSGPAESDRRNPLSRWAVLHSADPAGRIGVSISINYLLVMPMNVRISLAFHRKLHALPS